MAYGNFSTYEEVATAFGIALQECAFVQERLLTIKPDVFDFISENLRLRRNYVSENAICESMIAPILTVVAKEHDLPLWSHVPFDVSPEDGLIGIPDYMFAPASPIGTTFGRPVIMVAEAKRENFNAGWAQSLAEMIAAQRFNHEEQTEIFGIVTTGNFWQVGKLRERLLTMEVVSYSALEDLQRLLNVLNWICFEAKQQILMEH